MKTRVTITLDPEAHHRAMRSAAARKTSVSGLIESLLQTAAAAETPSVVGRMTGAAAWRDQGETADLLMEAVRVKYLMP